MKLFLYSLVLVMCSSSVGCMNKDTTTQEIRDTVRFEFVHSSRGEIFYAETSNQEVITRVRDELEKDFADRTLHINGVIAKGANGVNTSWSWHFIPDEWNLSEISIEVCDAWPGYIEKNLDNWIQEVGFFCPWASRVKEEVARPY